MNVIYSRKVGSSFGFGMRRTMRSKRWMITPALMVALFSSVSTHAQIATLAGWTQVYNGSATTLQSPPFTVPSSPSGSGERLLVLAVASSLAGTVTGARTVELSYGGQAFTLFAGDMDQTGIVQHTALYYLDEARINAATSNLLNIRVHGGNTALTTVWAAVYDGVDQLQPMVLARNGYTSGASTTTSLSFDPAFTLDAGDVAVKVICVNHTTLRSISWIGAGWDDPITTSATTPANPTRNALSQREVTEWVAEDAATVTLNNVGRISMTGAVVNGLRTTTTALQAPLPATSDFGEPVTFTATVVPASATGTVEFLVNGQLLGSVDLSGGDPNTAVFTTSALGGGANAVQARYRGDVAHRSSWSAPWAHAVRQVLVSGANAANGYYPDLPAAIAAIGTTGHAGADIVVTLFDDLRDAAAVTTIPEGDWGSLLIRPSGIVHLTASVNDAILTLNGADRVTIDGMGHDGPDRLVINNPNTGVQANAIRFVNDATRNTVRNCTLRGASRAVQQTQPGAVVTFWTGLVTGNDENTITHCRIRNAHADPDILTPAGLLPARGIYSAGSGGFSSLERHNSRNVIADNWIFNYFLGDIQETPSRGILLGAGNHEWTIRDNRLFQEEPRIFQLGGNSHRMIDVDGIADTHDLAGGHLITRNVLGYASADGTGTHHMDGLASPTGARDNMFRCISLHVANTAPRSTISHNVIDGIYHVTTATGTKSSSPVTLIYVNSGQADVDSNRIGTLDGATATIALNAIAVTNTRQFNGIFNHSGVAFRTRGNTVGGVQLRNDSFFAIRSMSDTHWECHNNVVGGTGAGLRIDMGSANKSLVAISARGGTMAASGNTVGNLLLAMVTAHNTGADVIGIHLRGDGPHMVHHNTVHDLYTTKAGNGGSTTTSVVAGIWADVAVTAEANSIRRLSFHGSATGVFSGNDIPLNTPVYGIMAEGPNAHLTARNNVIDSLVADFRTATTVNNVRSFVHGIRVDGTGAQAIVEGNTISRLKVHNGNSVSQPTLTNAHGDPGGLNGALVGINIGPAVVSATVHHNRVYDLENAGTANHRVHATGIRVASTGTTVVSRNLVHTIRASRSTGTTALQSHPTGIWLAGPGSHNTVVNNMVRLGIDADGTPEDRGYAARGIWASMAATGGTTVRLWHNSVFIGGQGTNASVQASHALLALNNTVRDYRNNILWNARSFPGTGMHYAMELGNPAASWLASDYNCLRATGTNGMLVRANSTNHDLATWQATGRDGNSFQDDPVFLNALGNVNDVDLHIALPSPIDATGVLIAEVEIDIDGESRPALSPVDIGADALGSEVLPVEFLSLAAEVVRAGDRQQVLVVWSTVSEANSARFVVERSADGRDFLPLGSVPAAGWSNGLREYRWLDEEPLPGVNYYRLRQEDLDDTFTHSHTVAAMIRRMTGPVLWPNPAGPLIHIAIDRSAVQPLTLLVYDAAGREVMVRQMLLDEGATEAQVPLEGIEAGAYLLRILDASGHDMGTARFIKQ